MFERVGDENLFDERWANDPGLPPIDDSIELLDASELALTELTTDEPLVVSPRAFQLLGRNAFALRGVYNQLDRSRDFQPLVHLAWHQPGYSRRRAKRAHIRSWNDALPADRGTGFGTGVGLTTRPILDGTVQVHVGKYLHVNADLLYYRPRFSTEPTSAELSAGAVGDAGSEITAPPELFRLTTHRRMRSRELHYLDHPLFGMLVLITPYVAPEPEAAETEGQVEEADAQ